MKSDIEAQTLADVDEDERYGYNFDWARNRTILKQLVKDNIDISMLKNELSNSLQQRGRKTWQQHLLTSLRSNMMQIILSLLVLVDAGIVITEIVLEIQSLQSYKNNFRLRLQELQQILCTIVEINTPDGQPHPSCLKKWAIKNHKISNQFRLPKGFSTVHQHPDANVRNSTAEIKPTKKNASYGIYSSTAIHSSRDANLLHSVTNLINYWDSVYSNHQFQCVARSNRDVRKTRIQPDQTDSATTSWRRKHQYNNHTSHSQRNEEGSLAFEALLRPARNYAMDPSVFLSESENEKPATEHAHLHHPLSFAHGATMDNSAQQMHEASEVLHYLSIAITGLFLICVIIKIICLRRKFFRDTNEYVDAGIIVASFASDVLYVRYASETAAAMVVFLLWRIIRIINALMMHKQQQYELRIAMQKRARRLLGRKMEIIRTEKEMQDKHIGALEELLREFGASAEIIRRCKPRYKKCTKEQTNNALKSIAALTTGVMGGLVGAPSNFQDVISKYGGGTTLNTPTTSQKSLQGMIASSIHNLNTFGRRPSQIKGTSVPLEHYFKTKYGEAIAKSISSNFEQRSYANIYNAPRAGCHNASEDSLSGQRRIKLCGNSLDDGMYRSDIPIPDDNVTITQLSDPNTQNVILDEREDWSKEERQLSIERTESFTQENFSQASFHCPIESSTPDEPPAAFSTQVMIKDLSYSKRPFQWNPFRRRENAWKTQKHTKIKANFFQDRRHNKPKDQNKVDASLLARAHDRNENVELQNSELTEFSAILKDPSLFYKKQYFELRDSDSAQPEEQKPTFKCECSDLENGATGHQDSAHLPVSVSHSMVSGTVVAFSKVSSNTSAQISPIYAHSCTRLMAPRASFESSSPEHLSETQAP